jgi:signal transduction histidine kinase
LKGWGVLAARVSGFSLIICVLLTIATVFGIDLTARMYHQEANQRLNWDLAGWLVHRYRFERDGRIDTAGISSEFDDAMRVNPSIEAYLVDTTGKILAYNAPTGRIKLDHVAVGPITSFLGRTKPLPILGSDPRNPDMPQVFSAAPIRSATELIGYAYVVVGGEEYQDLLSRLRVMRILRVATVAAVAVVLVGVATGFAGFWFFTRRITRLGTDIDAFTGSGFLHMWPGDIGGGRHGPGDELDQLRRRFHDLAQVVRDQFAKLQAAAQQLRDAVTSMSHDLRTPLTALGGYLETLSMGGDKLSPEERQEYLELAIAQQQRLARLVRAQFDLALLDSGAFPIDRQLASVSDLVCDARDMFLARATAARIELCVETPPSGVVANVDVSLLQRLLDNLVSNAIRHTPPDGKVVLRVAEEAGEVILSVRDTGCGIAAADLDRVFDPYFRAEERVRLGGGGTGLGLAIAKRIVELHGGRIRVVSPSGQGAVFECRLPA